MWCPLLCPLQFADHETAETETAHTKESLHITGFPTLFGFVGLGWPLAGLSLKLATAIAIQNNVETLPALNANCSQTDH